MSKKSLLNSSSPGLFAELWEQARLVYKLLLDPQVPFYLKALPFAAIAYLIFPFDFLPDVIPGLGQIDDLGVLLLGAKVFIELAPKDVVAQYIDRFRAGQGVKGNVESPSVGGKEVVEDDDIIEGIVIDDGDEE